MKQTTFMFIAFDSTHKAIHIEHLLMNHFAIELFPTPREVTASCGLSLKFEVDDLSAIRRELGDEELNGLRLFQYFKNEGENKAVEMSWR